MSKVKISKSIMVKEVLNYFPTIITFSIASSLDTTIINNKWTSIQCNRTSSWSKKTTTKSWFTLLTLFLEKFQIIHFFPCYLWMKSNIKYCIFSDTIKVQKVYHIFKVISRVRFWSEHKKKEPIRVRMQKTVPVRDSNGNQQYLSSKYITKTYWCE